MGQEHMSSPMGDSHQLPKARSPYRRFGFHIAGYYNYMTNKMSTLTGDVTGQSNVGFRLGVIF